MVIHGCQSDPLRQRSTTSPDCERKLESMRNGMGFSGMKTRSATCDLSYE